jgi:hypothetical protein
LIVDGAFATVVALAHRGTGRRIVPAACRADAPARGRTDADTPLWLRDSLRCATRSPGPRRACVRRAVPHAQRKSPCGHAARTRSRRGGTRTDPHRRPRRQDNPRPPHAWGEADGGKDRRREADESSYAPASSRSGRDDVSGAAGRSAPRGRSTTFSPRRVASR